MHKDVTILVDEPTIIPIAEMQLLPQGLEEVMAWVGLHRPECLPDKEPGQLNNWQQLFPHDLTEPPRDNPESKVMQARALTDNELLVEFSGRNCYHSFGLKAGKKTNSEYIKNTQANDPPHASILYHAKMTFFFAGISRRVSHELIRNYVGSDRDEEGSPSQESTRFTHHYGFFIAPPKYLDERQLGPQGMLLAHFKDSMQLAYGRYLEAVRLECDVWEKNYGKPPTSIDKKRIYEAASSFLPHQAETSFVWTCNPMWVAKFCKERDNDAADLEMRRFAHKLKRIAIARWPNVFPQPWMKE